MFCTPVQVVRKLRTPRRTSLTIFPCQTKPQKNTSLSKCDELCYCTESISSLVDAGSLRNRLPMADVSTITSTKSELLSEDKFSCDQLMSNIEAPQAQSATNLERFSKSLVSVDKSISKTEVLQAQSATNFGRFSKSSCQLSDTKKRIRRGFKRTERFTLQILQFIGDLTVPERLIRQELGNNPDTSKALRL